MKRMLQYSHSRETTVTNSYPQTTGIEQTWMKRKAVTIEADCTTDTFYH